MPKSQIVHALVASDFEYNDDAVYIPTDGHHVRQIFVNKRDALDALAALTAEQAENLLPSQLCYQLSELLRSHVTEDEFVDFLNKEFGHLMRFSNDDDLLSKLDLLMPQLLPDERLKLLQYLDIEFCKVIDIPLVHSQVIHE